MIPERANPFEQAVRRGCDHANAGPDLTGLTREQTRLALLEWNNPDWDAPRNVCPDCGEQLFIMLTHDGSADR